MGVHVVMFDMLAGVTDIGYSGIDEFWNTTFHDAQDLCCYILLLGMVIMLVTGLICEIVSKVVCRPVPITVCLPLPSQTSFQLGRYGQQ